jgi:aminotransferase in exopolysaccharide biosynthesis
MNHLINSIQHLYQGKSFIPLHEPSMGLLEVETVTAAIESTFVSSTGHYIDQFEKKIGEFTGSHRAIGTVNGTSALHACLYLSGVRSGDLVMTQALTFVATCNAIKLSGAEPILLDVSKEGLGLSAYSMERYLDEYAYMDGDECKHKQSHQCIRAAVPMHTFGHPVDLDAIKLLCDKWKIKLVEDAAESLGSFYKNRHTGTDGQFNAISFNGNKIITTGGGGMILCSSERNGQLAKHITTTAKQSHDYEFFHDQFGFNYRMPNLNAALGCAQFEKLESYLISKRKIADYYEAELEGSNYCFVKEPSYAKSNYWLNAVICEDLESRNTLIKQCNKEKIMVRPVWQPMHHLPMYHESFKGNLDYTDWLASRVVNIPSTPIIGSKYA